MDKKSLFRKEAKRVVSSSKRLRFQDKKVVSFLREYIKSKRVKSVLLYIPLKSEVDIRGLFLFCRQNKIDVYVPFMEGKSFSLVKYRLPLYEKCFGIKEPKFSKQYRVRDIDLAVVPILGVDKTCKRVGFGKGMYDRFFEREGKFIKETIFIQRIICFSQKIITQEYDIEADMIIGHKIEVLD